MRCTETPRIAAPGLVLAAMSLAVPANATTLKRYGSSPIVVAQAMIPRDGMMDAQNPMPMKERYLRRFPQPARVGHLIGMPVLDGHLVSLDMSPSEFAAAPTWRDTDAPPLPNDAIVRVALSRS